MNRSTEQRLDKLEAENKSLRCQIRGGAAGVAVLLGVLCVEMTRQDPTPKDITVRDVTARYIDCRGVRVLDADKPRIELEIVGDRDTAVMRLRDSSGRVRAVMGHIASSDYLWIDLRDKDGKIRVHLGTDSDGPSINFIDDKGNKAVLGCYAATEGATGRETKFPASTLTLLNSKGDVIHRVPR